MLTKEEQQLISDAQPIIRKFVSTYFKNYIKANSEFYSDLVSEGNLIVAEKIHTFDKSKGKITTWIYTILSTYLRNYLSKFYSKNVELFPCSIEGINSKIKSKSVDDMGNDITIDIVVNESINQTVDIDKFVEAEAIRSHIAKIPDKFGTYLQLFVDGYTTEEIAKEMNMTNRSIYHIKDVAFKKLNEIIKKDGFGIENKMRN